MAHREYLLVEAAVEPLQHLVVGSILPFHREVLLYALQSGDVHVLGNLHGGGAPGGNHLAAGAHKETLYLIRIGLLCARKKPLKGINSLLWLVINCLDCNDAACVASEKQYFHLERFVAANLANCVISRCDL